jgi:hypothetical protein
VRFDAWYVRFMGNPQICQLKKRRNISGWEIVVNKFRAMKPGGSISFGSKAVFFLNRNSAAQSRWHTACLDFYNYCPRDISQQGQWQKTKLQYINK